MSRYVLSPAAATDLVQVWRYIRKRSSEETANRVEGAIRRRMVALATTPGAGHRRPDLTALDVRFFPVYSYLIVYRETAGTLQIVAILHAARDVPRILDERL